MTADRLIHARVAVLLASMALPATVPADAQPIATSFDELSALVKPGDTISVTDVRGATTKGRLAGLAASSLQLQVRGDAFGPPVAVLERDVNNIAVERSDPLWNGMLVGFLSGAVPVAVIGLGASARAGEVAGVSVGYGGIGLMVGLLIDIFSKERLTVYVQRASPPPRVRVVASPRSTGVQLQVTVLR